MIINLTKPNNLLSNIKHSEVIEIWYSCFQVMDYASINIEDEMKKLDYSPIVSIPPKKIKVSRIDNETYYFDENDMDIIYDIIHPNFLNVKNNKDECINEYNRKIYDSIQHFLDFTNRKTIYSLKCRLNIKQIQEILNSYFIDTDYLIEKMLRNGNDMK